MTKSQKRYVIVCKAIILAIALLYMGFSLRAQSMKENRSFFKLCVLNDKKEVMLIRFEGEWEIPGASFAGNMSIASFLDTMALRHGIAVDYKQLAAQITFHHKNRANPVVMLYYTAQYKGGDLKVPSWGQEMKWVSLPDAYELIPYPEMVAIMKKFNPKKHVVWGGALRITYDKETKKRMGYQVIEDFYQLN